MAKDWKSELKDIITSNQKQIKQVVDDREKREKDRLKKIDDLKSIVRPRMEFIQEQFGKDKYLVSEEKTDNKKGDGTVYTPGTSDVIESEFIDSARRGDSVAVPTIKEDVAELALIMPMLSDVNRIDLMYKIEFQDEKAILHSYNLLPQGKMENNGSAHDNYEDFVQDTLKRFLLSWFRHKEGTELDKERKFELHIIAHALKDV
jgi:hypothetical protein